MRVTKPTSFITHTNQTAIIIVLELRTSPGLSSLLPLFWGNLYFTAELIPCTRRINVPTTTVVDVITAPEKYLRDYVHKTNNNFLWPTISNFINWHMAL